MDVHILGALEVRDGGEPVEIGRGKQRALFAVLVLGAGETVSADRLIEALWGESPPASALNSIRIYVSQLRKVVGDELLVTEGRGYRLALSPEALDAHCFERLVAEGRELLARGDAKSAQDVLRSALDLWRGPPLSDFTYDGFAQTEIARLEELRLAALEERVEAGLALGRHAAVVPELDALVRDHPLRERLRGQLMLALYRSGRQAEALEAYRKGRRLLFEELGLEPGERLRELERAILTQDPALGRPAASPPVATALRRRVPILVAGSAATLLLAIGAVVYAETRSGGGGGLASVRAGAVGVVDPGANRIVAEIPVAGEPVRLAAGAGAVWLGSDESGTVSELDQGTRQVTRLTSTGGFPSDLAAGEGGVWVMDGKSGLLRSIDPAYGGVARTIRLVTANPAYDVSRYSLDPTSVAAGVGSVWVTDGSSQLIRVDPVRNEVVDRIDLGEPLNGVAVGEGAVWTISGAAASAIRVDSKGRETLRIRIVSKPGFESPYPLDVGVGEGYVWVLNANTATVTKIDPGQRGVAATISIGIDRGPSRLAVGGGAAWIANADGSLSRIDPESDDVTTISVGHSLKDVAVQGGSVWVTTGSGLGASERVGFVAGNVRALPASSCSPVYYGGKGSPRYLIASDLPLQGSGTVVPQLSQAILFVLRQRGFKAGRYAVGYQSCDDSTAPEGDFSQERCEANARAYAQDRSVIGVVGTFNSPCAGIEIPILNRSLLAMVSPTNTYIGLTRGAAGTEPGEPGRYYPSGIRNYARVVAADDIQAAANAILARQLGARRIYVLGDDSGYGSLVGGAFRSAARKLGLTIVGGRVLTYDFPTNAPLAASVKRARPDAVFIAAGLQDTLVKDLREALGPSVHILASDGFSDFRLLLKLLGAAAEGMTVSVPVVPSTRLPPAGRTFAEAFKSLVGETPGPYAAAAAQAADVLLNAIARSDGTRASVTKQLLATKVSNGILGSFAFDGNGDTTAGAVAIYRIVNGVARVFRVVTPSPGLVR